MKKKTLSVIPLIVVSIAILGVAFCSEPSQNNQFPYIPQDYYPVKIEYVDAPGEVKFGINNDWMDFVNSWNISKTDEKAIENWVFRLTFGDAFSEDSPAKDLKTKKRSIEVLVGKNTILIDGIYYSCPDNTKLIECLVARWNQAPLVG